MKPNSDFDNKHARLRRYYAALQARHPRNSFLANFYYKCWWRWI